MDQYATINLSLWTDFKNGDQSAYASIFRHYYKKLYSYGMRFTRDVSLVEDCIQDVMTTLWFKRTSLATIQSPEAYVFICFRNGLIEVLRKSNIQHDQFSTYEQNFNLEVSIDQVMIDAEHLYEQQTSLSEAVDKLTQRQKEAIYLKFYENLSYDQVAGMLNISTKATYKLVARAIVELRQVYQQRIFSLLLIIPSFLSEDLWRFIA